MNAFVHLENDRGIAVLMIDNPPVNALSPAVVQQISEAVQQISQSETIQAAVMIGAGRNFVAGADINEFVKITTGQRERGPGLLPLLLQIEDCPKPVVMAIHGAAFGGGLELAMAGHYRVALASAQVGQPEVNLGIIPGGGGTQRLPRLAGVAKAVEMCAEGKPIRAAEAREVGIVDDIIEGDLLAGAVQFARSVMGHAIRKTRERNEKLKIFDGTGDLFAAAKEKARTKQRNLIAPLMAIDAVEGATRLSFEQGCEWEQKLFLERLYSGQSKALVHIFLGEREVAKIPDVPADTPVVGVKQVAIVGSGMMGAGIAMVFANAGIPVVMKDTEAAALDRGMANIEKNYATSVKRGRFTEQFVKERMAMIKPTLLYEDFAQADMVIEAAFESREVKKEIFTQLDKACKQGAILATNTSSLNIDEIAGSTGRPEWVVGLHFFSPANVMRLVEIVRGQRTDKSVLASCMQLAKKIGKVGVLVGNFPRFVGNRMFQPYRREAQFLVEEGAEIEAVDNALYEFGMAMGPLATADLAGVDIAWRMRKEHPKPRQEGVREPFIEDRLCEMGRFGQKTNLGWYRYDNKRHAAPDPEIKAQIREWAAASGIPQRAVSTEEIVERCIFALVNEGARILDEKMALGPVDIDVVYVNGYGFPAYRGGPMWYADTVGVGKVYERICGFERELGKVWEPAPLLKHLAQEGRTFASLMRE